MIGLIKNCKGLEIASKHSESFREYSRRGECNESQIEFCGVDCSLELATVKNDSMSICSSSSSNKYDDEIYFDSPISLNTLDAKWRNVKPEPLWTSPPRD